MADDEFKKHKSTPCWMDIIIIAGSELTGTAILLFLSCTGCTMGVQGAISSLHVSFAAGLAVMVVIQVFGHVSGAHVNPVVTLAALILNEISVYQVPVYILSQIGGCLIGSGLHWAVTPYPFYLPDNGTRIGVCVPAPNPLLTDWEALGAETILSAILVLAVCASWDRRNSDKLDSVALRIGLVVVALNVSATAYTGASMNPVRTLGPAVWSNDYRAHWVYWVGPTIGSLLAACSYKFLFSRDRSIID